jgi:hypothetical protein
MVIDQLEHPVALSAVEMTGWHDSRRGWPTAVVFGQWWLGAHGYISDHPLNADGLASACDKSLSYVYGFAIEATRLSM